MNPTGKPGVAWTRSTPLIRFALEAGSKVVLGFPIFLVIQVVDGKVEVDAVMDRFRDAEYSTTSRPLDCFAGFLVSDPSRK